MDEKMRKKIRELLLTPIICIKWNKKPFIYNQIIYTGQEYYSLADEDMSDFAVEFYNIIYKDIIEAGAILDKKQLRHKDFAGDTMNSFITIGKLAEFEQNNPEIIKVVMDYFQSYHCLANFWVLPLDIGRKSKKLNYYDSVDIFLERLSDKKEYDDIMKRYTFYKKGIEDYDVFLTKHFLEGYEIDSTIPYEAQNVVELIERAKGMMFLRADAISKSDKADRLYEYFKSLGMI